MRVAQNDLDDRAGLRGYVQFNKYTYIHTYIHKISNPQVGYMQLLLLLFLTFSALVANPKKTTLHGGQSRSWSAEQGKKKKKKVWQRTPPPPPARCSFGEKIKNNKIKIRKSRGASTCLGATQAGVTQVVSVRLASVQGFLRLVS